MPPPVHGPTALEVPLSGRCLLGVVRDAPVEDAPDPPPMTITRIWDQGVLVLHPGPIQWREGQTYPFVSSAVSNVEFTAISMDAPSPT